LMFPFLSLLSPSSHVNAQNGDYNNKESRNVLNTLATKLLAFFLNFYFGERWKEKRSNKPVMDRCICSWIIWRTEKGGGEVEVPSRVPTWIESSDHFWGRHVLVVESWNFPAHFVEWCLRWRSWLLSSAPIFTIRWNGRW
jgi:hypothetical protein